MSGGQSKSSGKSEQSSSSVSYTPEQKQWLTTALSLYGPTMGQGENVYQGETVAPFTNAQQKVMGNLENYSDVFNADRQMPMFEETGQALGGVLSGKTGAAYITPTAMEQYYQSNIEQPAQQKWAKETRPGIEETYAGPGYWSGARAKATTEAGTELQNWLGEQKGELAWNTLQENRATDEAKAARTAQAIPQAMQYSQLPTQEATNRVLALQNVFGGVSQPQYQQQAVIDAAVDKYQKGEQLTSDDNMAIMMGLLGMNYTTSSASGWSRNAASSWNAGIV